VEERPEMRFLSAISFCLLSLAPPSQAVFDEDGWPVQQQSSSRSQVNKVSVAEYEQFKRGNTIFDCEVSCAFVYDGAMLKLLYESEDWEELAKKTLEYGLLEDESYFFLAKAAEGLGHLDAARKYYKRSIAATNADMSCGGFIPTCEGFSFPEDARVALSQLTQRPSNRNVEVEQRSTYASAPQNPISRLNIQSDGSRESISRSGDKDRYVDHEEGVIANNSKNTVYKTAATNRDAIAVVIGNKNYSTHHKDVSNVRFAHNDHDAVVDYLIHGLGFREGNIISVKDATQADMNRIFGIRGHHRGELYNWVKEGKSDVFIFYSGHGVPDVETQQAYLLPVNASPNALQLNGYPLELLYQNLSKIDARSMTVILDACFSGQSHSSELLRNASALMVKPKDPSYLLDGKGAMIITASSGREIASWDDDHKFGLLTYYLLEGVSGTADVAGNNDEAVTLDELKEFLEDEVGYQARRKYGRKQTPQVTGELDRVVSVVGQWKFESERFVDKPKSIRLSKLDPGKRMGSGKTQNSENGKIGPKMAFVEGGCFQMGSPLNEEGRFSDEYQHPVCVDDFKMGAFEITNGEYRKFSPSHGGGDDRQPVVRVSWHDVNQYIEWLNNKTGMKYRLPTEAEWEYAARSGTATARYWGNSADDACKFGNVADQSISQSVRDMELHRCSDGIAKLGRVGKYKHNHLLLHDMLGNVWEWTCSEYDENYDGGESSCSDTEFVYGFKVVRGGGWLSGPRNVRVANRHYTGAGKSSKFFGFRLAHDK